MGRILGVVEDDDVVELTVELFEVEFPVGDGPTTVVTTSDKTEVVVCLPCPRPMEVDNMVVVIVLDASVLLVVF